MCDNSGRSELNVTVLASLFKPGYFPPVEAAVHRQRLLQPPRVNGFFQSLEWWTEKTNNSYSQREITKNSHCQRAVTKYSYCQREVTKYSLLKGYNKIFTVKGK